MAVNRDNLPGPHAVQQHVPRCQGDVQTQAQLGFGVRGQLPLQARAQRTMPAKGNHQQEQQGPRGDHANNADNVLVVFDQRHQRCFVRQPCRTPAVGALVVVAATRLLARHAATRTEPTLANQVRRDHVASFDFPRNVAGCNVCRQPAVCPHLVQLRFEIMRLGPELR